MSSFLKTRSRRRRQVAVVCIVSFALGVTFWSLFKTLSQYGGTRIKLVTHTAPIRQLLQFQPIEDPDEVHLNPDIPGSYIDDGPLNCTPRSIDQFPPDFMSDAMKSNGGVTVHILIALYCFVATAIVCDDYFVAALEKICDVLKLQPDVAGATFMAAGSSAPELFTSIIGVFIAKSDVGLGTIVGSAVFNILFIIALCGLFSGMVIYLTWWPMTRDCVCYMLSVVALIATIYDGQVLWYEAVIMIVMYILYIVLMYFNPTLSDFFIHKVNKFKIYLRSRDVVTSSGGDIFSRGNSIIDDERAGLLSSGKSSGRNYMYSEEYFKSENNNERSRANSVKSQEAFITSTTVIQDAEGYESPLTFPDSPLKKFTWIITLPITVLCMFTIPDCRRPEPFWKRLYPLTFFMSIVWIIGLSYIMVWMVTIIGDTLNIPDTVMGLTLLAAGTSVPDALASLFVSRDGYGDMAVSNSIGSNVFDILICLGLPWFIQTAIVSPNSAVPVESSGMTFTVITLFATVLFLLVSMGINGWKLNKKFGCLCFAVYVIVIVFACMFELNIFGEFNLPQCPKLNIESLYTDYT